MIQNLYNPPKNKLFLNVFDAFNPNQSGMPANSKGGAVDI